MAGKRLNIRTALVLGLAVIVSAGTTRGQEATQPVTHWIGVACSKLDGALKSHLKVDGLLVQSVVTDAPAAKAGVKVHDVITAVDGRKMSDVGQLTAAVIGSKGKAVKLSVIRSGKPTNIEVKPAPRPSVVDRPLAQPGLPGFGLNDWWRTQIIRPGIMIDPRQPKQRFPSNLSISISKSGDNPAQITVKQGDKEWKITEKELDKLPKDIRPHVESVLGRHSFPGNFGVVPGRLGRNPRVLVDPNAPLPRGLPEFPADFGQRFKQIEKQMEEMRKALEDFRRNSRGGLPNVPKPKKDGKKDKKDDRRDIF